MNVVVQRVVVRWSKRSRGAPGAVRRNAVPEGFALPPEAVASRAALVVHDVAVLEATGFEPSHEVSTREGIEAAEFFGTRLAVVDRHLHVTRLLDAPGTQAYPRPPHLRPHRGFTLAPGEWAACGPTPGTLRPGMVTGGTRSG